MTFAARSIGYSSKQFAATLTAGASGFNVGFVAASYGSLSPTGALGGTITDWRGNTNTNIDVLKISIASDPGQNAFTTATVTGVGSNAAASATYSYSGGVATWTWASGVWGGMTNTVAYPVLLQ